jgi:hypothetical protein
VVGRSLRAALGLVVLLIGGAAAAQPVLVMTDDKRRLEIASLSLEYEAGQVQARVTSARGGTLEAEGTWKEGLLALQFTAHDLDAETVEPWLLRAGPLPVASGTLTGTGTLRWKSGQPVRIEHSVTHSGGAIEWLGIRFGSPIQAQGDVVIGGGTRLENLRVEAAQAKLGDLEFSELNTVLQLKDKQLQLQKLRGRGYQADWSGDLEIDFSDSERSFRLALVAEDVVGGEPYEFSASGGSTVARLDSAEGGFRITGRWTGDDTWRNTLQGSGMARVRGGEIRGSPILPAVWHALASRVPLVKIPRLPKLLDNPNELIEGTMSFEVKDGAVHSEDIHVRTGDYVLDGSARLGFDKTIEAPLKVSLTQRGAERMITLVALPLPKSSLRLGQIPIRITGTWSKPEASADVERVPLSVLKMIFGYHLWP